MADLKDSPKEWRYKKGWRGIPAQVKVFDGFPKEGIHYMFKNVEYIKERLEDHATPVIWTRDSTKEYFKAKRAKNIPRTTAVEDLGILEYFEN